MTTSNTSRSLESQETLRGEWWPETNPELVVPGVLAGNQPDGYALELDRAFTSTPSSLVRDPWPIICGSTSEGPVTLLECLSTHWGWGVEAPVVIEPTFVLKGAILEPRQLTFDRIRVQFTDLDDWWGKWGIKENALSDPVGIRYEAPAIDQVNLDDKALVTIDATLNVHTEPGVTQLSQTAEVAFNLPSPLSIRELSLHYIQPIQNLITLACDRPSGMTRLLVSGPAITVSKTHGSDGYITVIGRGMNRVATPTSRVIRGLFTVASSRVPAKTLIGAWYELHQVARLPLQVLFSLQYSPPPLADTRLLLTALALESWHRTVLDHPKERPKIFKAKTQAILDQLGPAFQRDVASALAQANVLSLRQRVEELADGVAPALSQLIPNGPAFARRFATARNDITHFETGRHRPSGIEMVELAQTGAVVMTADILLRLGFDAPTTGSMLSITRAYSAVLATRAALQVAP